jgi:hypothetical protein
MHHVDEPGGYFEFAKEFAELDRVVRSFFAGFDDDGVVGNESRTGMSSNHEEGEDKG